MSNISYILDKIKIIALIIIAIFVFTFRRNWANTGKKFLYISLPTFPMQSPLFCSITVSLQIFLMQNNIFVIVTIHYKYFKSKSDILSFNNISLKVFSINIISTVLGPGINDGTLAPKRNRTRFWY